MSGHLHDIDIIDPSRARCTAPARGEAIALSAELRGRQRRATTSARSRRTTRRRPTSRARRCAGPRPTTGPRSAPRTAANGHLDTMSHCGIFSDVPAGAQPEAYPAGGAYSFEGYPIKAGQVIRLHSEYQNDSGAPKTDVMGIMDPWLAFPDPGTRGRRARRRCAPRWCPPTTSARAPTAPTARRLPGGSNPVLQPAGPDLEPAHGRHPRRQRRGRELGRLGEDVGDHRQRRRPRPTRPTCASRSRSPTCAASPAQGPAGPPTPPASPTTRASCRSDRPADHRPRQRPRGGRHGPGHRVPGHGAVRGDRRHDRGLDLLGHHDRRRGHCRARSRRAGARSGSSARCRSSTAAPTASPRRRPTRCSRCRASSSRSSGRPLASLSSGDARARLDPVARARRTGVGHGQADRHAALRHAGPARLSAEGDAPERLAEGETYRVRLLFFGLLPAWWHEIRIVRLDDAHREIAPRSTAAR